MEIYNRLTPIATDTVNDSIDFLPHFEYVLFRVVQLLHPKDPTGIIRENYPPTNVVIFQGSPLQAPTYCFGSPTEIAIPTPTAGFFPINLDHSGDPIILNNISVNDPDWIPRHTADLRRHPDTDLYHVACDPKRIPFSLAVRLIPVYTTGPSGQTIYQAWALPHLDNALRDPELQLFNNFLSYYHTAKENHPEFPFIDLMGSDSPVPNYGESSSKCLHYPGCYAGYLPLSICDSLSCPNQIESAASNNIITFQQDNSTFSGPHFACLAVSTRRSSLLLDPTRTPDPQDEIPAQNDPQTQIFAPNEPQTAIFTHDEHGDEIPAQNDTTGENPTQNTTDSPEIHSQQLISDAETTYDEHAHETQQLPGTQPNLAFLPPNSPETRSSHTETPSNLPPTAKSTTGPLKRFSDAFSGILTPKNVKLPHNPDATNSNPQPPISTTFRRHPKLYLPKIFDLWPKQVSYSHPFVGTAIYNLIFTNVCDPCQKHIIDGPPDARTAILTLQRHCAPLTPDHIERTREAFCSIKQPHHEVATSYLNRIRLLTRDCYHAGISNTDAELIKRTVRGGSNHSFYAASYQRFDADIRRAELHDEALPPFAELESHLLNIDESRGLTLPSQNHRNYNQHANAARGHHSHHFQPRHNQTTQRVFTQRQQQTFSSILRPYSNPSSNNQNRNQPPRPPQNHSRPFRPPTNPSRPPFNNSNQRRPPPPSPRPSNQPQRNNRPPSDRRPVLINVHLLTDPTTTIRATLPMPLQSSQ
ncbi:hypothetical protein MHU86_17581 [Fragilaria crotonensis]|nr:hypothetical protein MHU86_17581 [Fragilaria crotonensis]